MSAHRILIVGDFSRASHGANYYNTSFALMNGFVRAGCHVLTFSDRDTAREAGLLPHKKFGRSAMNKAMIECARSYRPHLVLFGHVDMTGPETIDAIRKAAFGARLAQFHVDALFREQAMRKFQERGAQVDISFVTTADQARREDVASRPNSVAFFPNPVDPSIATSNVSEQGRDALAHDVIFLGNGDERREAQVRELQDKLPQQVRFFAGGKIFGTPRLGGPEFLETLATGTMSPNLPLDDTRKVDFLYSSNRIAQLLAQGLVAFCQESARLDELYDDGIVGYRTMSDLADKMAELTDDDARRQQIAKTGWRIGRERTSAQRVAQYMLDLSLGDGPSVDYGWPSDIV